MKVHNNTGTGDESIPTDHGTVRYAMSDAL